MSYTGGFACPAAWSAPMSDLNNCSFLHENLGRRREAKRSRRGKPMRQSRLHEGRVALNSKAPHHPYMYAGGRMQYDQLTDKGSLSRVEPGLQTTESLLPKIGARPHSAEYWRSPMKTSNQKAIFDWPPHPTRLREHLRGNRPAQLDLIDRNAHAGQRTHQ